MERLQQLEQLTTEQIKKHGYQCRVKDKNKQMTVTTVRENKKLHQYYSRILYYFDIYYNLYEKCFSFDHGIPLINLYVNGKLYARKCEDVKLLQTKTGIVYLLVTKKKSKEIYRSFYDGDVLCIKVMNAKDSILIYEHGRKAFLLWKNCKEGKYTIASEGAMEPFTIKKDGISSLEEALEELSNLIV